MFEKTDALMEELLNAGIPGNDILICVDGKEVYRSFRGYSDLEKKIPMNGKERYSLYSCSKMITAVSVLRLIERKLLRLDTQLREILPEFGTLFLENGKKAETAVTIRHLLSMTSGFTYNVNSASIQEVKKRTEGRCPTLEIVRALAKDPISFEPGTKWQYSLSHDILAGVIEMVTGQRFGAYVKENIFDPLGMRDSTFLLPEEEVEGLCAQYRLNDRKQLENCGKGIQVFKLGSEYESGGAGLISTVEDYMKFQEAVRTGTVLSEEFVKLMATDAMQHVDVSGFWTGSFGYSYGLGVRCPPAAGNSGATDFGWGGAAGAYFATEPELRCNIFYGMQMLNISGLAGRNDISKVVKQDLSA